VVLLPTLVPLVVLAVLLNILTLPLSPAHNHIQLVLAELAVLPTLPPVELAAQV
jgi:hypothetical protein